MLPDPEDESEIQKIREIYKVPLNTWILKPGENTNRGIGINVCQNLNEIKQLVNST